MDTVSTGTKTAAFAVILTSHFIAESGRDGYD